MNSQKNRLSGAILGSILAMSTGAMAAEYDVDRDVLYQAPVAKQKAAEYDVDRDVLYEAPIAKQTQVEYDTDRDILYSAPTAK